MRRARPTSGQLWIGLAWGVGAAAVLTPAAAIIARAVALVIAPQVVRRAR
jgi:hypothetical protein